MDKVIVNVSHSHSDQSRDLEIPVTLSIYELIDIVTSAFEWADTSLDSSNHKAFIETPGEEVITAQVHDTLTSLRVQDGSGITIVPISN